MSKAGEERFVFEADWFDTQASLIRKYLLTFFPGDNTIEMVRGKAKTYFSFMIERSPSSLIDIFFHTFDRYLCGIVPFITIVRLEAEENLP